MIIDTPELIQENMMSPISMTTLKQNYSNLYENLDHLRETMSKLPDTAWAANGTFYIIFLLFVSR